LMLTLRAIYLQPSQMVCC